MSKKELAIILSKLKQLPNPDAKLEQYQTDSEIAAYLTWLAYLNNDITKKIVADLGCGNGTLGIASLILGAEKVYFADISKESIELAKENLASVEKEYNIKFDAMFLNVPIEQVSIKADTVVQNPPFGVKNKYADKQFLEKAMMISNVIYSIHKAESSEFIYKLSSKYDFKIDNIREFNFPLKKTLPYHEKKLYNVKVACYKLKRNI